MTVQRIVVLEFERESFGSPELLEQAPAVPSSTDWALWGVGGPASIRRLLGISEVR